VRFVFEVRLIRHLVRILPILAAITVGAPLRAAPGETSAMADALFREGRAALARGDYPDAYAKLSESQRLEPSPGTLINLALAEEKLGRLTAAWEHARAALDALSATDDRRPKTNELLERLDRRLPRLTIRASPALPSGTIVERNGVVLGPGSFDVAVPVEPGAQTFTVKSPGRADAVRSLVLREGQREQVVLAVGPVLVADAPPERKPLPQPPPPRRTTWPATGAVALGATSLVASGVFGLFAIDRNGRVEAECDAAGCSARGLDAAGDGRTFATVSTITFVVGALFTAIGVTLFALR